jgi:putative exporter of polyketide antibiotics
MAAALKYFLYCVGVGLSLLWGLLLGGFHMAVEPDPNYWTAVAFGCFIALIANLGLLLVPTAVEKGVAFKLMVAAGMIPTVAFLVVSGVGAVSQALHPAVTGVFFIGVFAYGLGFIMLLKGR